MIIDPLHGQGVNDDVAFHSLTNQIKQDIQQTKAMITANDALDKIQGDEISANTLVNALQEDDINTIKEILSEITSGGVVPEEAIAQLNAKIDTKADASAVAALSATVDTKVATTAFTEAVSILNTSINTKANATETANALSSLTTAVESKADLSDVENRIDAVNDVISQNQSATTEAIDAVSAVVDDKVAIETFDSVISGINETFESKADMSAVTEGDNAIISEVEKKADTNTLTITNAELTTLVNRINALENKVTELTNSNVVVLGDSSEIISGVSEPNKFVVLNGEIHSESTETASTWINLSTKSVEMDNITVSNNTRLRVLQGETVAVNNAVFDGAFPYTKGDTTNNSILNLNNIQNVSIINSSVNNSGATNYNAFEIGLDGTNLPKNVVIDGCSFNGKLSNNAILIFGTQDNATITISNCYFENVSNCLRLSNRSNATGVTVNIVNCVVDQWESSTPKYAGFLLCEDYTSNALDVFQANNLFGDGKITVNFTNLIYQGEKITKDYTGQISYVYADKVGIINNSDYCPIVNVN